MATMKDILTHNNTDANGYAKVQMVTPYGESACVTKL